MVPEFDRQKRKVTIASINEMLGRVWRNDKDRQLPDRFTKVVVGYAEQSSERTVNTKTP